MRVTELLWIAPIDRLPPDGASVLFYEHGSCGAVEPYDGFYRSDRHVFVDAHDGTCRTAAQVAFWAYTAKARQLVICSRCNDPSCRPVQSYNPTSFCWTCGQPNMNHCYARHVQTQFTIGPEHDIMVEENGMLSPEPEGPL